MSGQPPFFIAPTGKPVGSYFVTYLEPTDLSVGERITKYSFCGKNGF